jgi:hypothetical protein
MLVFLVGLTSACRFMSNRERIPSPGGSVGGGLGSGGDPGDPGPKDLVTFTPVGASFETFDLIDLEFLPGQNGEALVISKSGTVFYLDGEFSPLPEVEQLFVEDDGERGLLNVIADPDYADNHYVYFYYTVGGFSPDLNRVRRYTVDADVSAGTFELREPLTIIQFWKIESPNPASNHNGGSLSFDEDGALLIGVGDGGGGAGANQTLNLSQDPEIRLGKIHRVIPDREPFPTPTPFPHAEHFEVPIGQDVSDAEPSIFAFGFRNPFRTVQGAQGELWVGDVGLDVEEVDDVTAAGDNFGWPQCEGSCAEPGFQDPLHGYLHDDEAFLDEDPAFLGQDPPSDLKRRVLVLAEYQGDRYDGVPADGLIYTDFYLGWVRVMRADAFQGVSEDWHLGHQSGLTVLQENPADGFLYGVSTDSDRILRMEQAD